ncbi:MAG TPA: hypothetical protein VMN78_00535 [Longimicrobiales bacterium]|nr:hypothetical protein [Longimicrobiales bacterium]
MSPRARSAAVLLGTLVLGIVLGALGLGAFMHHHHHSMRELHDPDGLVSHMLDAIEPRDEAQRQAILPHLRRAADATTAEFAPVHERLMAELSALRDSLRPILTDEQMRRLDEAMVPGRFR